MTKTYRPGGDVTVKFDMVDEDGGILVPTGATWNALDETGTTVDSGTVSGPLGSEIEVVIEGSSNTVTGNRGYRIVTLVVTTDDGTYDLRQTYLLRAQATLVVPAESAQTLAAATMLAADMTDIDDWVESAPGVQEIMLKEAWMRLCRLRFRPWRAFDEIDDTIPCHLADGAFKLNELTSEDWNALPTHFKLALARAQIREANQAIGGDPIADLRESGLMSKTVGESSEMYRQGKPLQAPLAMRAGKEISGYIDRSLRTSRA